MKKYIKPALTAVKVNVEAPLATSILSLYNKTGGSQLSKTNNWYDDEEDDDEW